MVVLKVGVFLRSLWILAPPHPLVPPSPTALVSHSPGTHSPAGVFLPQLVSQNVAGFLSLFGQTLVGNGVKETGPEACGWFW